MALASLDGRIEIRRRRQEAWSSDFAGPAPIVCPIGGALRAELGPARIMLASGSRLELQEGSVIVARASNGLELAQGEIFCEIAPGSSGFFVATPHGRVVVAGTAFGLRLSGDQTEVFVSEGTVRVSNDHGEVEVHAGYATRLFLPVMPAAPYREDADLAFAWRKVLAPPATGGGTHTAELKTEK
jgi:ferric-dicitrate binding protein FerR (iron transport regulator)